MRKIRVLALVLPVLFIIGGLFQSINLIGVSSAIDVDDGTLTDWEYAFLQLYDNRDEPSLSMTDLTFVAFDYDDTWLYVRWDIFNDSTNPEVLYDMGINLTGTGTTWDIFVSAHIETIGVPTLTNISIRIIEQNKDVYLWNGTDDGNMDEDGTLYLDPAPGIPPGNHSVEARFPLSILGITTGVIFGQFRSHASGSVRSNTKDTVPDDDEDYIILIIDYTPPELSNLNDNPDPQENGGPVNITVDVWDDIGVKSVWINITYPNGSWTNETMKNTTGNGWYFEEIFDDLGLYYYTIWANDTRYWNSTGPGNFTIQDTDGPFFDNLMDTPDPQENGDFVNITVDITDDIVDVDSVRINVTYNGFSTNQSMLKGPGNQWYYNKRYDDLGTYSYTIWANDTLDNWNYTGPETFAIQDMDGPFFANVLDTPDQQEVGGSVNISVDVWDDIAMGLVWVNITFPDSSYINETMTKGIGDNWYYNITYDVPLSYSYTIWANDSFSNWNSTGPGTFTILDIEFPEFWVVTETPDPQENGGFVNITADIVDNIEINEAWVNITFPDGSWINDTMTKGTGYQWFYNTTYDNLGDYSYKIWAKDAGNNWNSSITETFKIHDKDLPEIADPVETPDPQENDGQVNITVEVTDDVDVEEVWINITYPDGTWINESMDQGSDDEWYFVTQYPDLGDYEYTIWAKDVSSNWNSTGSYDFAIIDTDNPVIEDPVTTPDPQEEGGDTNITVDVTDDVGIDEVWINITFPDGTWINVTMTQGSDDEWYLNRTFDDEGDYTYTIWAVDESGNWNKRGPETFKIVPPEPPEEPPEKEYELLHMVLIFMFWPLFLIIFTILLVRRYGSGNRFKRDMAPVIATLAEYSIAHPEYQILDFKNLESIKSLSKGTGIPQEEFIIALLESGETPFFGEVEADLTDHDIGVS
ncbi:MAG: hypothetical protein JSW00_11410 [Thermoplasmata archaeon]|nr:MAG: hypothetical protein JSW00_11410 [Thermoplasmata archaeon]